MAVPKSATLVVAKGDNVVMVNIPITQPAKVPSNAANGNKS